MEEFIKCYLVSVAEREIPGSHFNFEYGKVYDIESAIDGEYEDDRGCVMDDEDFRLFTLSPAEAYLHLSDIRKSSINRGFVYEVMAIPSGRAPKEIDIYLRNAKKFFVTSIVTDDCIRNLASEDERSEAVARNAAEAEAFGVYQ